ncbi:MAG TPA: hypothetical protein P5514_09555 [Bacteroidales bacterium]|nr:hypothetical protein [Bacteroidales bacterium]HPE57971.1 hypothetical protein [Bacteroidales bacterium]HRX97177.1 hypothetical protein [Bacteroidales bacterium]
MKTLTQQYLILVGAILNGFYKFIANSEKEVKMQKKVHFGIDNKQDKLQSETTYSFNK